MISGYDTPPIRRHRALAPLSRDHYVGLVHAQRLIKSASQDRVMRHKALADFLDAWSAEIHPHFLDEERLLAALIPDEGDRRRLREDHADITAAAEQAAAMRRASDPDPAFIERLGRALERHIRWEERTLFARVQEGATPRQLELLTVATEEMEGSRRRHRTGCAVNDHRTHAHDPSDEGDRHASGS